MKIAGIEKTTLIDYPDKIACTIFLHGCNFRCGFCHNPELVIQDLKKEISEKEILDYLKKRKGQLEGVCITGGEPLMSIKKSFLKKIKKMGYSIKIDTNGSFPRLLKEILDEELVDFVAMDIKSCKNKYSQICGCKVNMDSIEKSIKLITSIAKDYEFRTTIIEDLHNKEEIPEIAKWLNAVSGGKPKKLCLQGFKNKGKVLEKGFESKKDTSEKYLEKMRDEVKNFFGEVEIRA